MHFLFAKKQQTTIFSGDVDWNLESLFKTVKTVKIDDEDFLYCCQIVACICVSSYVCFSFARTFVRSLVVCSCFAFFVLVLLLLLLFFFCVSLKFWMHSMVRVYIFCYKFMTWGILNGMACTSTKRAHTSTHSILCCKCFMHCTFRRLVEWRSARRTNVLFLFLRLYFLASFPIPSSFLRRCFCCCLFRLVVFMFLSPRCRKDIWKTTKNGVNSSRRQQCREHVFIGFEASEKYKEQWALAKEDVSFRWINSDSTNRCECIRITCTEARINPMKEWWNGKNVKCICAANTIWWIKYLAFVRDKIRQSFHFVADHDRSGTERISIGFSVR